MYRVDIGDINGNDAILYYPADKEYVINETSLNKKVGKCGTFDLTVPKINPKYTEIKQGAILTIYRNDKEHWRGEINDTEKDFLGNISVYCVEDLSFLNQEPVRAERITNETYAQRFQSVLDEYNRNQVGDARKFEKGYITCVNPSDICDWRTEYEWSMLDALRENIAGSDGFVRVRRERGKRYIDIVKLSDYGVQAAQPIEFGINLLDYIEEMEMGNLTNYLIPVGAETEEEIYPDVYKRLEGEIVYNEESIARFGRHAKTVIFETESVDKLNALAQAYITRYSQPQLKIKLLAVDLGDIEYAAHFNEGDSIRVTAEPFGIDQWIYLTELDMDILDISQNEFELSSYVSTGRTLTEQTVNTADFVADIPDKVSLMQSARKNIINLLEGANDGSVTYKFNEEGQPIEIRIMNNIEESQATRKWVINLNGIAHMYRENTSEEWKDSKLSTALTMDGDLLARSGLIGSDDEAWSIGGHSIFNGTKGPEDYEHEGIYVGTDGILVVAKGAVAGPYTYTKIAGGRVVSNTRAQFNALTAVSGLTTPSVVNNSGILALTGNPYVSLNRAQIGSFVDANGYNMGYTGIFTYVSTYGSQRATVVNGIITKIESL